MLLNQIELTGVQHEHERLLNQTYIILNMFCIVH
jgi:hypothetical protein